MLPRLGRICADDRLASSPQLEGFRARGIEVLLLTDQVDSFWVTAGADYEGKPFKSVTQGLADLSLIPLPEGEELGDAATPAAEEFINFVKEVLRDDVSDVRASERLTESAVCLVAFEQGMDRQLEKLLSASGRSTPTTKPILELNLRHQLVAKLSEHSDDELRAAQGLNLWLEVAERLKAHAHDRPHQAE
jgi:molecular chaperone HtpG